MRVDNIISPVTIGSPTGILFYLETPFWQKGVTIKRKDDGMTCSSTNSTSNCTSSEFSITTERRGNGLLVNLTTQSVTCRDAGEYVCISVNDPSATVVANLEVIGNTFVTLYTCSTFSSKLYTYLKCRFVECAVLAIKNTILI